MAIGANGYRSIVSIPTHRLDRIWPKEMELAAPIEHHNIRGTHYNA